MDPHGKFLPPKTEEEFKERAEKLTVVGAEAVLDTLKQRRAAMVANIDLEIKFYEKAIKFKQDQA